MRHKYKILASLLAMFVMLAPFHVFAIESTVNADTLSKSRQTPFGLYLTPADAHAALQENPGILLIDVRDPVEVSFVGHADGMDANIPLAFASGAFNPESGSYKMVRNGEFVSGVDAALDRLKLDKSAPVFVICRSGSRSAAAARLLHAAGYTQVWNLVEGFEGSIDPQTGGRNKDGWRNAGLPWSYKIPADAAWTGSE